MGPLRTLVVLELTSIGVIWWFETPRSTSSGVHPPGRSGRREQLAASGPGVTPLATVMTTVGVIVLMALVAPFTRAPESDDPVSESNGQAYVVYALIGVNLLVLAVGVVVAAVVTFFA
jgi:hypothetical protein